MIDRIRKAQRDDSGFTLIELLVVVIIIGILAAIAIPVFLSQRQRAWESELQSDVRNQALEVEAEATSEGGTPPAVDAAWEGTGNNGPTGVADITGDNVGVTNYTVTGTTFCLEGEHTDLDAAGEPDTITYDSSAGGLQDVGTTC